MHPQGKPVKTPGLSPVSLINLCDELSALAEFSSQKDYLEAYLEKLFGTKSYIWLKKPHKLIISQVKNDQLPFDPHRFISNELDSSTQFMMEKIEGNLWVILPLVNQEEIFGYIFLYREQPFSDADIANLKNLSKVAGLAVYASMQNHLQIWQQKQLALVRSVTMRISQITNLGVLTQEISRLIQQTFNLYYVAVFLIHERTRRLHFMASAGSDQSDRPEFEQNDHPGFELGEHMIGHVAKTGTELIANDVTKEPRYQCVDSLAATKSEAVIPLMVETRIFGVLDFQADTINAFDNEDLMILRALADNIAIAIESARLYQSARTRADLLTAVSDVSRAITSILDTDALLQKIVTLIHERFQFPYVHLYTIDPVNQQISFKAGSGSRTHLYEEAGITFDIQSSTGVLAWVAQNGKTKRVDDIKNEPLFLEVPLLPAVEGSEMVVPLSFGNRILGILDLQSDDKFAFTDEDQQIMETLADNLAIAIRNARLYRSEKWRRQVAESLKDVAGLLSDNLALEEVLGAILAKLHGNLPCDIAGIWLFINPEHEDLNLEERQLILSAYQTTDDYSAEMIANMIAMPDNWAKSVLEHKDPIIRQGDQPLGPLAKLLNFPSDYSAIAAALTTDENVLGMLTMIHHTPDRYGLEAQKIIAAFSSYAAIAIKNNRLYAKSQEQAWIATILLQVANAIQSITDLNELTETIVRLTPMVVGVKGCALLLKPSESNIFQISAMYGIIDSTEDINLDLPLNLISPPIMESLLVYQEPLYLTDVHNDLNLPKDLADLFVSNSLILFPLVARNEVLGGFLLADDSPASQDFHVSEVFSEERYRIVQGIMQQTAIAIENIRLIEARQEEAYVSAVLLQAAQAIVSSAELQDTLDSMVNIMPILVGIDTSLICLWDQSEQRFRIDHATTKSLAEAQKLIGTTFDPGEFPMLDAVFRHSRPIVYPFIESILAPEDWDLVLPDDGQIDPTPILQTHYPLLMGFPLSVKDEIYGVLLAEDENYATNRERRFELLWGIAQQASLAIQNDRLNKEMLDRQRIEREFQLAREIQQTFLPNQIPDLLGWELDVRWETARQVGGDFYDFFILPDGRLAFVIADVSDKGLAASLYMAVTRTLLRAAALESDSPARTLEHVNELLLDNSQNGLFVTTFYGILSLVDGRLAYTIAGHNPPVVIRKQHNDVITLDKGGIALGALPGIQLPELELILNPGDCLVLYTDGVTEAFNHHDEMYGDDRFIAVLQNLIGKRASTVLEALEADLAAFREGAPLSDDTTTLAICRADFTEQQ